jgi:hypothetical protein
MIFPWVDQSLYSPHGVINCMLFYKRIRKQNFLLYIVQYFSYFTGKIASSKGISYSIVPKMSQVSKITYTFVYSYKTHKIVIQTYHPHLYLKISRTKEIISYAIRATYTRLRHLVCTTRFLIIFISCKI